MVLSKKAIHNLDAVLTGMEVDYVELLTVPQSNRPYVVIGPKDEYGKEPRLVLDDVDSWEASF